MIENRISGYLFNERFSDSNEEKCTAFQNMAWSFIVHKNTIQSCSNALQVFSFWSLSISIIDFFFHEGKDTSAIPQPNVQHLVYILPNFFRFHKCFDNFHLSKNIFTNNFFTKACGSL